MTDFAALAGALRQTLGPQIGVGVVDPCRLTLPLWPAEQPATTRMRDKRYREFAAGRVAARAAMADLGLPPAAILMGADRAPVWPEGICGSISHSQTAAVALVARNTAFASLGIDVEEDTALPSDLWPEILTPGELEKLQDLLPSKRGVRAKAIFSAKESVYKAQYLLTKDILDFNAVSITMAKDSFQARLSQMTHPIPKQNFGRIFGIEGRIVSVYAIQPARAKLNLAHKDADVIHSP